MNHIIIPNSVTSIGSQAFSGTSSLKSINIPNSVEYIGNWAFSSTGLTSLDLPIKLTEVKGRLCSNCYDLNTVVLGDAITKIGMLAFTECTSLQEIYSLNVIPPTMNLSWSNGSFYKVDKSKCVVKVPAEAVEAYKAADGWKDFKEIIGIDASGIEAVNSDLQKTNNYFNLQGQLVNDSFKGVVIRNGRKMLRK